MEGITLQQALPVTPKRSQGTALPVKPRGQEVSIPSEKVKLSGVELEAKIAKVEQRRVEIFRDIANKYVLGDTKLSMFYKDVGGQYVTRFVNLRDGKVTYIPEPSLMALSGSGGSDPSITIDI